MSTEPEVAPSSLGENSRPEKVDSKDAPATGGASDNFTMEELDRRMKQLLEVQKQLAQRDPREELSTAILLDRAHKVQALLNSHADLAEEYTPNTLFSLALSGKPDLLKLALQMGADVNTPGKDGMPTLVSACRTRSTTNPEIWRTLLDHKVDIHKGDGHFSPLQKAINNEDDELIKALIEAGVDPNAVNDDKGTALYFALHMNCVPSFHALLGAGADPTISHRGQTLLHYLPQHREIKDGVEASVALIEAGAEIDAVDSKGLTPFLVAVSYGRLDLMKELQSRGANIHARDQVGGNALWVFVNSAIGVHHPECADWLLSEGVDKDARVGKYETPVSRLHKFVSGVSDSDVYTRIADVFRKYGARFEDEQHNDEDVADEDDEDDAGEEPKPEE